MSITQTWNMLLVPEPHNALVSMEFHEALNEAQIYLNENLSVIEAWKCNPECFGWFMLACDINDKHQYYESWVNWEIVEKFYGFFVQEVFDSLFFQYSKLTAPKTKAGKLETAEVVVTHGETPPHILFQCIGLEALDKLPGFFGNFYISREKINSEIKLYNKLISKYKWDDLVERGATFYNAPCNNEDNKTVVEEVIHALPKALKYANEKDCGLLGLVVTAG